MRPFAAAALWGPAAPPLESASGLEGGPRTPKPGPPRAPRLYGTPLPSSAPRPGAPRAPRPGPLPLPPARPPRPAPFRPLALSLPPALPGGRPSPWPRAPFLLPPPLPLGPCLAGPHCLLASCQCGPRPFGLTPPARPDSQAPRSPTSPAQSPSPCTLVARGRKNGRECGLLLLRKHSSANIARLAFSTVYSFTLDGHTELEIL